MAARHLINEDGEPFEEKELEALAHELDSLTAEQRTEFRNKNAETIANHPATEILIVAGPGTGKSTIFKQRVLFWLGQDKNAAVAGSIDNCFLPTTKILISAIIPILYIPIPSQLTRGV